LSEQASALIELKVWRCASFFCRTRGLLGRAPPGPGEGLWLTPCRQVHTLGMAYPLDAVHLGAQHEVLRVEELPPWRLGHFGWTTSSIVELRAGEAARLGIGKGVRLGLIESPPRATTVQP
jgi:uncharacterized membrane protein (UPF0127 family)